MSNTVIKGFIKSQLTGYYLRHQEYQRSVYWCTALFFPHNIALYVWQWPNSELWLFQVEFKIEIDYQIYSNKRGERVHKHWRMRWQAVFAGILYDSVTVEIMLELGEKYTHPLKKTHAKPSTPKLPCC